MRIGTLSAQKASVSGDQTFMQLNPRLSGAQRRALNSGGGGFQYSPTKMFGFGELLFGGSNSNIYGQLKSAAVVGGQADKNATQHPFTMALGGLDAAVKKHVVLRLAEINWVLTRCSNLWTSTNKQNHFRHLAGIVFNFGGQKLPRRMRDRPGQNRRALKPGNVKVHRNESYGFLGFVDRACCYRHDDGGDGVRGADRAKRIAEGPRGHGSGLE